MRFVWGTLLALAAIPVFAEDVYRSVDQDGNVIYSDRPEGTNTVVVHIATRSPASRGLSPRATGRAEPADAGPVDETVPREPTAQERAENCVLAQERAERYSISHRLYRSLPDGEREYLDDAEIDAARVRAAADVDTWCS